MIPEPEAATQAIYGDLDSVVEAVFDRPGTRTSATLLAAANRVGRHRSQQGTRRRRHAPGRSRVVVLCSSTTTRPVGRQFMGRHADESTQ